MTLRSLTEADFLAARELYWQEDCLHAAVRPDCIPRRSEEEAFAEQGFFGMLQGPKPCRWVLLLTR